MTGSPAWILSLENVSVQFGGLKALDSVTFQIAPGAVTGVIGPNGAGKTTLFNVLSGIYAPTEGRILLRDAKGVERPLEGLGIRLGLPEVTRLGVARTFQNLRVFPELTVREHLRVAKLGGSLDGAAAAMDSDLDWAVSLFGLAESMDVQAKALPYGHQKKLEILRAFATGARVLLLDEPAAGLNPAETHELTRAIAELSSRKGISIVVIEHDMKLVMKLCSSICVLDFGRKIAQGTPVEIQKHPDVLRAYLGDLA